MQPPMIPATLPNLELYAMCLVGDEVATRGGDVVNIPQVLREYTQDLQAVVQAVQSGTPLPETFFVPDLWRVTKGAAKLFPPGDGAEIWSACVLGIRLGAHYYRKRDQLARRNGHPGTNFVQPGEL